LAAIQAAAVATQKGPATAAAAALGQAPAVPTFKASVAGKCVTADGKYPNYERNVFPSFDACKDKCAKDALCKGFAFAPSTKNCQHYATVTAKMPGTNNKDPLTKGDKAPFWNCYIKA
jgi:hypothetical protein